MKFEMPVLEQPTIEEELKESFEIDDFNIGKYAESKYNKIEKTEKKEQGVKPEIKNVINILKVLNNFNYGFDPKENGFDVDNYFIQAKIKQINTPPLENWGKGSKISMLSHNWYHLQFDVLFAKNVFELCGVNVLEIDSSELDNLSEKNISVMFDLFREEEWGYFDWQEKMDLFSEYDNIYIRKNYNIAPLRGDTNEIVRESSYSKISDKYAAIYNPDGIIDSFFETDNAVENDTRKNQEMFGVISESNLEFFISLFKRGYISHNTEDLLCYFQIRKKLPLKVLEVTDRYINIDIPDILNKQFESKDEFEECLKFNKNELIGYLSINDNYKNFKNIIDELEKLLNNRKAVAKQKYFGYASENIEIIDFFRSFVRRPLETLIDRQHFSISYYLYLRKKLPDDLVDNFEKKFNIQIPDNLKSFDTFDDYLNTSSDKIIEPFVNNQYKVSEMAKYLDEQIYELSNKIKKTKITPNRMTLDQILEKEGFIKKEINEDEYERMLVVYQSLIELPLRKKTEKDFDIKLSDFKMREEIQFVNFLSSKTVEEVEEVKNFLNQASDKKNRLNRIKSFLSLETGEEMGEKILNIGESLSEKSHVADSLFETYSYLTDNLNTEIEEIVNLYDEMFFEKTIDKLQLSKAILKQSSNLLAEAEQKLSQTDDNEKKADLIKDLINDLNRQKDIQKQELNEFRNIAIQLNQQYKEIGNLAIGDDTLKELEEFQSNIVGNPDFDEKIKSALLSEQKKHRKYDSTRIKEMIEFYEGLCILPEGMDSVLFGEVDEEQAILMRKRIEKSLEEDKIKYQPIIDKYKKLLPFQLSLEKKLEKLILGQESVVLPKNLLINLETEVSEIKPEQLPEQMPLYFPVGVSKDMPAWEGVFKGESKFAKPIDIYGWLFWLNNQEKNVQLVVCDKMQKSNYQSLYNKSESDADLATKLIGEKEREFYQKIIETYNLDNIRIVNYDNFLDQNREKFDNYKKLCNGLSQDPIWAKAFLSMVQESVGGKEEKEKFLPYAVEELSWILATDGTKVSHLNEARYDILASFIKNMEAYASQHDIDIFNPADKEKLKPIINGCLIEFNNKLNTLKSKTDRESSKFKYYEKVAEHLKQIRMTGGIDSPKDIQISTYNFAVPETGAQSFGWRSKGEQSVGTVKFKEPYSTYFYPNDSEMFLRSDQVVASPSGHIGGKILTLESDLQVKYVEQVVKPLLLHYFKSLEHASADYFSGIKKTREELVVECKQSSSLVELLKFIQKYIVKPTFAFDQEPKQN